MERNKTGRDLDESERGLGTLLRMPYQVMLTEGIEPALDAAGFGDVRSAHFPVIQALARHPDGLRSTELATYARITKQSMGYLVEHLLTGAYVERAQDPTDLRAKVVRLTPRGWTTARQIQSAARAVEADWGNRVGTERMQHLREILQDLVASFNR